MKRLHEKELSQRLRDEGRKTSPSFSPVLHERVIHALQARGLKDDAAEPRERHWMRRIGIPLAVAAAVAVATWLMLPRSVAPPPQPTPVAKPNISPPETPRVVLAPTSAEEINRAKYAYLDRDAQRLFYFVASQLPELPTPPDRP